MGVFPYVEPYLLSDTENARDSFVDPKLRRSQADVVIRALLRERSAYFLTALFSYILKADSKDDERPLRKAIEKVDLTLGRKTFMTIAESLIERGKEKGKEEGLLEEKQQVLSRLLDKKFGLGDEEKERIVACQNKEKLDKAIDEFVTASDKAEVLRQLD